MKKRLLVLSVGLGAIFGFLLYNANAGFEPSPFQPEINQLGAVANILNSADFRVSKSIAHPPEPCVPPEPCKGLNGAVNRLEAIENQVTSAGNMVGAMIEEVMGFEPTPFRAEDLIPPLQVVRDAAEGIALGIEMYSPDPQPAAEFLDVLWDVGGASLYVVETAEEGIVLLNGALECAAYENSESCVEAGCTWIVDATEPFCQWVEY